MHKLFCILLIPIVLLSLVQFTVPHSHDRHITGQTDDHVTRPHFHYSHGHHSRHQSEETENGPSPRDHDSDAVYVSEIDLANNGRVATITLLPSLVTTVVPLELPGLFTNTHHGEHTPFLPWTLCDCFLHKCCLRC